MQDKTENPEQSSAFQLKTNNAIIGRTPPTYWWFIVFFMGAGFAATTPCYFDPQISAAPAKFLPMCVFWWAIGFPIMWIIIRGSIIADDDGLWWRGMAGWKRATWMQVRDYYIKPTPQKPLYIVETDLGRVDLTHITHAVLLRQKIQREAKWAKATSWEERDKKVAEANLSTPVTYKTDMTAWWLTWVFVVMMPLSAIGMAWPKRSGISGPVMFYWNFVNTWQMLGPWWALGSLPVYFMHSMIIAPMLLMMWPMAKACRERRTQTVTISIDELVWRDTAAGREIHARWNEVTDFYLITSPGWVKMKHLHVVETKRGSFDFAPMSRGLVEKICLRKAIQTQCAKHGLKREWTVKDKRAEDVDPRQAKAVNNLPVREGTSHTYHLGLNRSWILYPTLLPLPITVGSLCRYLGLTALAPQTSWADFLWPAVSITALWMVAAWLWWIYRAFEVRTTNDGLLLRYGRKERFIPWTEIEEYELMSGYITIRGTKETIRFYYFVTDPNLLRNTITQRAVNSQTKSW